MNTNKKKLFRRCSNAIAKAVAGCSSNECIMLVPDQDDCEYRSATPCRCKEALEDLARQLTKEVGTIR